MKTIEEFIKDNKDCINGWITVDPDGEVKLFWLEPHFSSSCDMWIGYFHKNSDVFEYGIHLELQPSEKCLWRIGDDKAEEKVQDITGQSSEQNVEKDLTELLNQVEYKDAVNHPSHYTVGGIECIEAMRASMTEEAFKGYLKGCAQKYLWRYEKKANPKQDIEKAIWYLTKLKDELDDL